MTRRILVTGAGALLGQGIIRSLRRSAMRFDIVAVDPNPLSVGLYWADRGYTVPLAASAGYVDRVSEILSRERPDLLMVGTNEELPIFAARRAEFERDFGCRVLVSDPDVVAVTTDKYRTYQFMRDCGFHPPQSALPADSQRLIAAVGFPLVVKPRVGGRSIGLSLVKNEKQLRQALESGTNLVVQEHVGGPEREYTAGTLRFEGQEIVSIVMRRDLRDGNTYRAFAEPFSELNNAVAGFAHALKAFGPANFQFRLDAEGRPRVFEINGRFSGTTPLRALVGFPEVEMCVRHLLDGEPLRQPEIKPMTILRHWSEIVVSNADIARIQ
jgi:carbamoyl-phosphate synthase large subunit